MKSNDIRKLAKEIRTGNSTLGYEELAAFAEEASQYVEITSGLWTDRTKKLIDEDLSQIEDEVKRIAPKPSPENEEESVVEEMTQEAKPFSDDSIEIRRKAFGTVLKEMAGRPDPILETVRWFAVVYAGDTYNTEKCVKGMLQRRGYELTENGSGYSVSTEADNEVATIKTVDGIVSEFDIVYAG